MKLKPRQILQGTKELIKTSAFRYGYNVRQDLYSNDKVMDDLYRKRFPETSLSERRFYNIGAASFRHKYWKNVDIICEGYTSDAANVDVEYDITKNAPLPIDASSAEVVYTSHTVEHVFDENAQNLFCEAYRILKPGSVFRVTCPDIDLAIHAYRNNDLSFFRAVGVHEATLEECLAQYCSSAIAPDSPEKMTPADLKGYFKNSPDLLSAVDHLSKISNRELQKKNPGNHVNWYNKEKIVRMLKEADFKRIHLSGQQQSLEPVLRDFRYFDSTSPMRSVYVDAVK